MVECAELSPRLAAGVAAGDHAGVAVQERPDLCGRLAQQIDAERARPHRPGSNF
ncbi:hypothetical protein FTUN_3427 [Frigoriglobus tundricola]|uniref:Uncharacterized protein n=1 Tax=Frigoriglobus tundricola TaxID=2774151 RepID=A0A6M5YRF1_9BACT|nr:hypothetical protein FTUN_3427 [Frigoriglobus tundricola]